MESRPARPSYHTACPEEPKGSRPEPADSPEPSFFSRPRPANALDEYPDRHLPVAYVLARENLTGCTGNAKPTRSHCLHVWRRIGSDKLLRMVLRLAPNNRSCQGNH